MDWKQVANEPWIWICGAILAALSLYQCTYFLRKALRVLYKFGLKKDDVRSIVRSAVITSFGPVMAELFVMIALVVALSPGFAWQREGAAVGSVFTELVQAQNAAVGAGQEFGSDNFDMIGFANVVFVMNVSCIGWLLVAGLFTPYLGKARQRLAGGDTRWLTVLTVCATLGLFGYWAATYVAKMGVPSTAPQGWATIAAAAFAMVLFKLADRMNMPRLKEWALGIAMFGGMIVGKLIAD